MGATHAVLRCGQLWFANCLWRSGGALLFLILLATPRPALGQWTSATSMRQAHSGHTATLLQSGQVLVVGGGGRHEIYTPGSGIWSDAQALDLCPRLGHTATLLDDGTVLVAGTSVPPHVMNPARVVEIFRPSTGDWLLKGNVGDGNRGSHTATRLSSGEVLVVGGYCYGIVNELPPEACFNQVFAIDTALYGNGWTTIPGPSGFALHTATLLPDQRVLVTGGILGPIDSLLSVFASASTHLFDPGSKTWSDGPNLSHARWGHTATLLGSGITFVAGGQWFMSGDRPTRFELTSVETLAPDGGVWAAGPDMSQKRVFHTATLLQSGKVLVVGGESGAALDSVELYEPRTNSWRTTAHLLSPRSQHQATMLSSGKVLVTGGTNASGALQTAELYEPLTIAPWTISLPPRGTTHFASIGGTGTGFGWSLLANGSGGSLDGTTGLYTAGPTGNSTDTVQLTDSSGEPVEATVTVTPGVRVSPGGVTLPPGGSQSFQPDGGSGQGFIWTFDAAPSGGSVDSSGLYRAGRTGSVSDVVRVTDSLGNFAVATIEVTASIAISPPNVKLQARGSQAFSATGGSGTGFGWTLAQNASGATLNGTSGVYTAGAAGGTDIVEVTDSLGNTAQATVTVAGGAASESKGCSSSNGTGAGPLPWLILMLLPALSRKISRRA